MDENTLLIDQGNICRYFDCDWRHRVIAIHKGHQHYKAKCHSLARNIGGRFSSIEEIEGRDLFSFINQVERARTNQMRLKNLVLFAARCMTSVNGNLPAATSRGEHTQIRGNTRNPAVAAAANAYLATPSSVNMAGFLDALNELPDVQVIRADLFNCITGVLKKHLLHPELTLSRKVGVRAACEALEVSPATFYRRRQSSSASKPSSGRASSPRALVPKERQTVHDTLNSERFVDQAPTEVYATLLDAGKYLCSVRTMYRILEEHAELRERRDQLRHPNYEKPVLLATGPNQVWSWDITKLLGPMKWVYFHLYVILDIFSRYVVGWMLAERESAELAKRLIKETCSKQGIVAEQLTLHADRGTSMKSKPLAMLLSDLGVTKTHSRPQVSNDNPYSESQFKTLKYRPEFPKRFGSIQHARDVCRDLFGWYNTEHYHSGIGTTLLVKGLEFDHAIVLDAASLSRKELYVAFTRGARSLTIISTIARLDPED